MDSPPAIAVVIPACDEEEAIGKVLQDIPDIAQQIIVVDNGSADRTAEVARCLGACVVAEPSRGYGQACLTGMAHLDGPDIVVFLDGDYSDYPEDMLAIVRPIIADGADMVIGSRVLGQREKGALLPQARFGNWLATFLIRLLFGVTFTDLGPFRALRYDVLMRLEMQDRNFGWTAEMQVKAARLGLRTAEVPVRYRRRIGSSKITGTLSGTLRAGYKILWTIFRYVRWRPTQSRG